MRSFLTKVPLPMAGLTLGLASLGNLYKGAQWQVLGNICGGLALALFALIVGKFVLTPRHALANLANDPIVASVAPTISMTLMILCTYFTAWGLPLPVVRGLWVGAVALHFALMIFFVIRHLLPQEKQWHMVYPSWFVTFVGLGVMPVTSGQFFPNWGVPLFWVTFALYVAVFPVVIHRVRTVPLPEAAQPLLTIVAAPASLCLTGYLAAEPRPNFIFATALVLFAQTLYWLTLAKVHQYTRLSFYPSFAAFTFPLVISATALTRYVTLLTAWPALATFGHVLQGLEWLIASFMLVFVTGHYLNFLHGTARTIRATADSEA